MAKKKKKKKPIRATPANSAPATRVDAQANTRADVRADTQAIRMPRGLSVAGEAFTGDSLWSSVLGGLLIFLISTPVIVGPYGQLGGYTPDLHMAAYIQVGAMVVLTLFLLSSFVRKQVFILRSPVLLPLLLFYGWAMLSILWADTKYEAVVDGLDWSGAFLCAFLVVLLLRNVTALNVLLFFLFISGLLMALLGIGQWLFGIDWVQQHIVPAATFSNKNMAGQYGVLTLPIAVILFLRSRSNLHIWFFSISMALIVTYIVYTRSRGALVGLLTEIIILSGLLIYLKHKHGYHFFDDLPIKKVALGAALALFLGMTYLTPAMLGNEAAVKAASIGSKGDALSSENGIEVLKKVVNFSGSADTRTTMWGNSIPMFRDNFLVGVGLGNWTVHYATYQSWFKPDKSLMRNQYHANAHNDYIEILCELGIIGFALFIWVIVSFLRVILRLLNDPHKDYFLIAMGLILAVAGIAVNAMFSFPLKQPVPIFMVMIYIAVLSNVYGLSIEAGRDYALSMPAIPFRGLMVVLAALATAGLFGLQYNWYKSELYYRTAVISLQSQKYREAYAAAKRAHELNPLRTNLLWLEATALMHTSWRKNTEDILEKLKQVDRARPYSSSTLLNLAEAYKRAGHLEEWMETMERLISVQPTNTWLKYRYGSALVYADKRAQGEEQLREARKQYEQYAAEENPAQINLDMLIRIDRVLAGGLPTWELK